MQRKIELIKSAKIASPHQTTSETTYPVVFMMMQSGNKTNGGVESITQIIKHSRNISPIIITQIETPANQQLRAAGASVQVWPLPYRIGSSFYRSNMSQKLQRIASWIQTNYRMRRLVQTSGSRVVHCNDALSVWHAAFGARSAGAAVVHNIRGVKTADQTYGRHWNIIFRLSQQTVVLSKEMQAFFYARFPRLKPEAIEYIYSIVDLDRMQPVAPAERGRIRRRLGLEAETFAIGYLATFDSNKGQLPLIEKVGPSLKDISARLYCLGDFDPAKNEYARACLQAVRRLGLEEVICFVGYTTQVVAWYQALDLVVLASRREGLARCMIESLASGTPVVSFDVCSAREILEGHACGVVTPRGDYQALNEQIKDLAANEARRQHLGRRGVQVARSLFEAGHIVRQYEALYQALSARIK